MVTYLLNQNLLRAYYIPGTFLGTGNLQINKICFLSSRNVQSNGGKRHVDFHYKITRYMLQLG